MNDVKSSCKPSSQLKNPRKIVKSTNFSASVSSQSSTNKVVPFNIWINSPKHVLKWLEQYDIPALVDQNGGLVRISNFLPTHVAEGILRLIESVPEKSWNDTSARTDYLQNNISHSFWSVKTTPELESVFRLFSMVQPGELHTFSAAKYQKNHHIAPHDDRAYTNVRMENGKIQLCSRSLAVIFYLTKNWTEEIGGALVDHEAEGGPKTYVPEFNSVVSFRIPRYHEVTPMHTERPRYTVFGWFLKPGKLYNLYRGEDAFKAFKDKEGITKKDKRKRNEGSKERGEEEEKEQNNDGVIEDNADDSNEGNEVGEKPGSKLRMMKKNKKKKTNQNMLSVKVPDVVKSIVNKKKKGNL